jgi:predicted RND superfamily exporter protein
MLGFLVLIFASMMPLINFGILIAITMFFSGMGSITILPSIIKLFNLRLVKKLPGEKT